jgi:hypothetical protein
MAHVRSTAHPRDDAPAQEGEGVVAERDTIEQGRDSTSLVESSESVGASDAVSQSNAEGDSNGGSHTHNYNFGRSMVSVGCI